MNLLQSAFLGFVQGITEYLPISSTAHLRIVPAFLAWPDPGAAYTAIIQLGSLFAVFLYFWKDLRNLTLGTIKNHRGPEAHTSLGIIAGTVPICVFGLLFKDWIENELRSPSVIAGALIVVAFVMAFAEKIGKRTRLASTLTFWEIQLIGIAQAMALIPGTSRSGATLAAALFIGMRRDEAARFSFLLSIPAIGAAGLFQLKELFEAGITPGTEMILLVGTATAFVSSLAAIDGLIRFLKTRSTMVFIVYRILLGAAILSVL